MANISITEIQGYDSISSSRLTINDNFSIVTSAVNGLLALVNSDTGVIDITGSSLTGSISAKSLSITTSATITGSLSVTGSANVSGDSTVSGKLKINTIWFGSTGNQYVISENKTYDGTHYLAGINLFGVTGGAGNSNINTKVAGTFDYMVIPKVAGPTFLTALQNPQVGTFAFSISGSSLWLCTSTSTIGGATGVWKQIQAV